MATIGGSSVYIVNESTAKIDAVIATRVSGHANIPAAKYQGDGGGAGDIDTLIGVATADITAAAGSVTWTNIVNLAAGPYLVTVSNTADTLARIDMAAAEDSGDALRLSIVIDGTTIFDAYVICDTANAGYAIWRPSLSHSYINETSAQIYCKTSFLMRAARVGTTVQGATLLQYGIIDYEKITL